ncbi:MAG TPA: protein kinase, partial [Blastocatellia bacterium]
GGMGSVYRATHLGTKRTVAVKVILPQYTSHAEFVERFRREAEAAGQLRHPNIVDVTDFGFASANNGQIAYLVMEYLDGCTLADVLEEESQLPLHWVIDILEQVASALDQAHRRSIVHRDLKPDNIWLEPNRRGGYTVKVLDFGLAKLLNTPQAGPQSPTAGSEADLHGVLPARNDVQLTMEARKNLTEPINQGDLETRIHSRPSEDAATLMVQSVALDDSVKAVLPNDTSDPSDSATQVMPESKLKARVPSDPVAGDFSNNRGGDSSATALTRIGSVMGTPLYMSPEQCRGDAIDARSDIYSLGVIAYRMIAGKTPFKGDLENLIKLHTTAEPPPIRNLNRQLSKRAEALIMSALAKEPDKRPNSALAFASALRARSEGAGAILRRAFSLYSEHFPLFFKISLIAYAPLAAILVVMLVNDKLGLAQSQLPNILLFFVGFIGGHITAYSVIAAVTVPVVTQLTVAPLRPVSVRSAFRRLKDRLGVFLVTLLITAAAIILTVALFIAGAVALAINWNEYTYRIPHWLYAPAGLVLLVPAFILAARLSLFAPIVMTERRGVIGTLRRAGQLWKRSRFTILIVTLLQFLVPILIYVAFNDAHIDFFIALHEVHLGFTTNSSNDFNQLLNILVMPLMAIMNTLVCLRALESGGESADDAIEEFATQDIPRSRWQARMRGGSNSPQHSVRPRT